MAHLLGLASHLCSVLLSSTSAGCKNSGQVPWPPQSVLMGRAQVLPALRALQHLSATLGQVPTPHFQGQSRGGRQMGQTRWETDRGPFQHPYSLTFPPTLSPNSARVFLSGLDSSSILPNVLLILKPQKPSISFLYYLFSTVA